MNIRETRAAGFFQTSQVILEGQPLGHMETLNVSKSYLAMTYRALGRVEDTAHVAREALASVEETPITLFVVLN